MKQVPSSSHRSKSQRNDAAEAAPAGEGAGPDGQSRSVYDAPPPAAYGGYGGYGTYGADPYGQAGQSNLGGITLERLLRLLTRKGPTVLLASLLGISAAVFQLSRTTRIYRASSLIEMKVRQPKVLAAQAMADEGSVNAFNTRLEKFKGSAFRAIAAERFAALHPDPVNVPRNDRGALPNPDKVKFDMKLNTGLISITVEDPRPDIAAAAANAFAEAAETGVARENKQISDRAVEWLRMQADTQREKVAAAEQALIDFRADNKIDSLEGDRQSGRETLKALHAALVGIQEKQMLTKEVLNFLNGIGTRYEEAGSIPDGLPRAGAILAAMNAWREAVLARDTLKRKYTAEHPDVIDRETEIAAQLTKLRSVVADACSSVVGDLALLDRQAQGIQTNIAEKDIETAELERKVLELKTRVTSMERERDASDIAYKGILNRMEEARMSADEDTAIVKVLDRATVPSRPIAPKPVQLMALWAVLGLLGGLALAFVTDALEDNITSFVDIENYIGLRVLGLLPIVENVVRGELATASLGHDYPQLTEFIAGIRGTLDSAQYREAATMLLVTSAVPEEGKTIVSCNLAIVSARTGLKTLLIDFDMRRPRLRGIMGNPAKERSLLHLLKGEDISHVEDILVTGLCNNLDVITSYPDLDIDTADVVGNPVVAQFLEWAREHYDRVIIDSPPFGLVSDAAVLAAHVTGVLLVCRPGKSRKRASQHAVRKFSEAGINVLGVIVNGVDFSKHGYFSNYHYQDSYYHYNYYSHGYYSSNTGSKKKARKKDAARRKEED